MQWMQSRSAGCPFEWHKDRLIARAQDNDASRRRARQDDAMTDEEDDAAWRRKWQRVMGRDAGEGRRGDAGMCVSEGVEEAGTMSGERDGTAAGGRSENDDRPSTGTTHCDV